MPGYFRVDDQAQATIDVSLKPSNNRYDYKFALLINPHSSSHNKYAVVIENPGVDTDLLIPYANYAKGRVELPSGILNNDAEFIELSGHASLRNWVSKARARVVHNFSDTSVAEFTMKVPVGIEFKSLARTRSAYQAVLEHESKGNMYFGRPGESVDFVGGQFGGSTISLLPASVLMGRIAHPGEGELAYGALAKVDVLDNATGALIATVWSNSSAMGTAHVVDHDNTFAHGYFHVNVPNVQKVNLRVSYKGSEEVLTGAISLKQNTSLDLGDIYLISTMEDELEELMAFESTLSDSKEIKNFIRLTKQVVAVFATEDSYQQKAQLIASAIIKLEEVIEAFSAHSDLVKAATSLKNHFESLIVSSDIEADNGTITWENNLSEGAINLINESMRKLSEMLSTGKDSQGDAIVWVDEAKRWSTQTNLQMLLLPELEIVVKGTGSKRKLEEAAIQALAILDDMIPSFNGTVPGIALSESENDFILDGTHSKLFYTELNQIKSSIFSALK